MQLLEFSTHNPNTFDLYVQPAPAPAHAAEPEPSPRSRCGRKRFGFYPGEIATIQRMVELRAQGMGFDRIADILNAEAVPTRSGKVWHGRVINRILKAELESR